MCIRDRFNSLPAEINDWDMIFRDRAGLLCDLEDTVQFLAQCRHILPDLVVGDAGIDLGRGWQPAFCLSFLCRLFGLYPSGLL